MSTERARFGWTLGVVVIVLALLGGTGAVIALLQGPRLTGVQSDPASAIRDSGSRLVMTANEMVAELDPSAVSITPHADFTVDVSGRSIGVRFTQPLDSGTEYTVTVSGVQASGGGPASEFRTTFTTPTIDVFVLQRTGGDGDSIVRSGVHDGAESTVIFHHPHIEDMRADGDVVVVSVLENTYAALIVLDRDGQELRRLRLPGQGHITHLEVSASSGLVGYLYSDADVSAAGGRSSVLFTGSLDGDAPLPVLDAGKEVSVDDWRFVPDSTSVLFIDWNSELLLIDTAVYEEPTRLGFALRIDGMTRGTYTAVVQRAENIVRVDLRTGRDTILTPPRAGVSTTEVTPLTGTQLLWPFTIRDDAGLPTDRDLLIQDGDEVRDLLTMPISDPILQVCASPSGHLLALTIAPDLVNNPYDSAYLQPTPGKLYTSIVRVDTGQEVTRLDGFAINWCALGPW